jgi:hypothetical protein
MNIPTAKNPYMPFIKKMVWIYIVLSSIAVTIASVLVWVLDEKTTYLGALIFCGGQLDAFRVLISEQPKYRLLRLAIPAFLMVGGITLQIFEFLSSRP